MLKHKIEGNLPKQRTYHYSDREFNGAWDIDDYYLGNRRHSPAHEPKKYDKLGYSQYLERIGFKRGDLIVSPSRANADLKTLEPFWFNIVVDVQEIHHLVEYQPHVDLAPKSYYVVGLSETKKVGHKYWLCGDSYRKVSRDEVSDLMKEVYDSALDQITQ